MANRGDFSESEAFRFPEAPDGDLELDFNEVLVRNVQVSSSGANAYDFDSLRMAAWSDKNRYNFDVHFAVFAEADDPAASFITTRLINTAIASSASFDLARRWIHECLNDHRNCPDFVVSSLPSRVLDVGSGDGTEGLKLRISQGEEAPYAALSYCWGGPQLVSLTTYSIEEMTQSIAMCTLPQTIQDAITTTRKLGLRFLWVDALCILQDSMSDKDVEITRMGQIYHNAHVTICAASAERCHDGFLEVRSRQDQWSPSRRFSKLPIPCPDGTTGNILLRESRLYYPATEPLNRRAWALQERLLSPRVLTYGSWQLYWRCHSLQHCDGGSTEWFHWQGAERLTTGEIVENDDKTVLGDRNQLWDNWTNIIGAYTGQGLTVPSDRLPALSGIAAKFQKFLDDIYCAGLWRSCLQKGLSWQVGEPRVSRPSKYRAPTWAWPSVYGEILWENNAPKTESEIAKATKILACSVSPANPLAPLGGVTDGILKIKGIVKTIDWDGAEQIPKDPEAAIPVSEKGIGSSLFPEGIIALAKADFAEETLYMDSVAESDDQNNPIRILFCMVRDQEGVNNVTRQVMCLVLDDITALMLEDWSHGSCVRVGLMVFKSEEDHKHFVEGCDEKILIVR